MVRGLSRILCITALCTLLGAVPALAKDGVEIEELDAECRALQLEVQGAVGNEDPAIYRNHGAYVSTVAHLVGPEVEQGNISEECASCIISQFARRIPVEEQTPCGPDAPPAPECEGASCGNFLPCNEPNSCESPVCVTTSEGGGACLEGTTPCAGLSACPGGVGDCPPGYVCAVQTCCGGPVCVPPSAFCETDQGKPTPPALDNGPTLASTVPGITAERALWSTIKSLYQED